MIFFFILNHRPLDFKQLLEEEKTNPVDSSSDKLKALITNVASQPLKQVAFLKCILFANIYTKKLAHFADVQRSYFYNESWKTLMVLP